MLKSEVVSGVVCCLLFVFCVVYLFVFHSVRAMVLLYVSIYVSMYVCTCMYYVTPSSFVASQRKWWKKERMRRGIRESQKVMMFKLQTVDILMRLFKEKERKKEDH